MKIALVLMVGITAALGFLLGGEDDAQPNPRAVRLAGQIEGVPFSLADAIRAAEQAVGGRAVASKVEIEKDKAEVEVHVLKAGTPPRLIEVDVEGGTNKILDTDELSASADDDDDEDDGDDDDDDDDEDDDDDGDDDD